MVFLPVFGAMLFAVVWGLVQGVDIPWFQVLLYVGLLAALAWCFLGLGMLISTLSRSTDVAQGAAFLTWLFFLLFLDLILLGALIQEGLARRDRGRDCAGQSAAGFSDRVDAAL